MTSTKTNIRLLFLEPKPSYSAPEAATLLGMTSRELGGWVEAGELEGEETKNKLVLPWPELVSFAMGFWDQEEIEAALGDDLVGGAREEKSVSAVLGRELLDFVSTHSEWLARDISGFAEALAWPVWDEGQAKGACPPLSSP